MAEIIKRLCSYIQKGQLFSYLRYKIRGLLLLQDIAWKSRQHKYLLKILIFANKYCRHYQDLGIIVNKWSDIYKYPLLSKDDIKQDANSFLSSEIMNELYITAYTGGSTGEPLKFYKPFGYDAIFQRKLFVQNGYRKGDIILALDGEKIDENEIKKGHYLYKKNDHQLPYGGWGLSSLYLTEDNISDYCNEIINLRPAFIRGYPSFVYRLAQYIKSTGVTIDFEIKGIELTSEMSYKYQLEMIHEVFSTNVFLQYGHTEEIIFGYTFDDSLRYRVEPLYGFVEIINDNGEQARIGEEGEIVVTSLHNKVMPFIRYRTGDRAEYGGEDEKGLIINNLLGRTQDYVVDINGNRVSLTALIFAQHFSALGNIKQWQIEQYEQGKVIIHIKKGDSYSVEDEKEIRRLFFYMGNIQTTFDYTGKIVITDRGKSLLLVQHMDV